MGEGNAAHCRLWLPRQLCVRQERRLAIVGWVNEGPEFLDLVVVAGVATTEDFGADVARLQRSLDSAESKLEAEFRTERKLCVIGEYRLPDDVGMERSYTRAGFGSAETQYVVGGDNLFESLTPIQHVNTAWALLSGHISGGKGKNLDWVPNLHRIIRHQSCVALRSTHIIVYNQPQFCSHHYSSLLWKSKHGMTNIWESGNQVVKKPVWLSALEQQKTALNTEMIMQELNCARFIDRTIEEDMASSVELKGKRVGHFPNFELWRLVATAVVTIWATVLYCLARVLTPVLSVWLPAVPFLRQLLRKSMIVQIMRIRCQQLMAWPFMLLWGGLGPEHPNVANAHRVTLAKHSTRFSLLIDMIAGAVVGCLMLYYHSTISSFLIDTGKGLTNDILRTGCVWLMGVPAGFKINTELAAVFGTLSLHWIQTWSTLLFTSIPVIRVLLYVLGGSGIMLGFTVFAAMVSDMVTLSTIHVVSLHAAVAFIYSNQLRALAALFRLFRGRKRNVLRGRLDSFDCSVEQLVVGSLMFTPLLLLLPTTSVFYTFFSIIFLTVSSIQLSVHCVVSILLSFPFCELATWFLHPKQFPSGVWMRFVHLEMSLIRPSSASEAPSVAKGYQKDICRTSVQADGSKSAVSDQTFTRKSHAEMEGTHCNSRIGHLGETSETYNSEGTRKGEQITTLLTLLEIRTATFGELLRPFFETRLFGSQLPSAAALAYKVVSGERFSRKPQFGDCGSLPHTSLSARSFAKLCYIAMRR